MQSKKNKAERCGVCFFLDQKTMFTLVKTKDEHFNNELLESTYFGKEPKKGNCV